MQKSGVGGKVVGLGGKVVGFGGKVVGFTSMQVAFALASKVHSSSSQFHHCHMICNPSHIVWKSQKKSHSERSELSLHFKWTKIH